MMRGKVITSLREVAVLGVGLFGRMRSRSRLEAPRKEPKPRTLDRFEVAMDELKVDEAALLRLAVRLTPPHVP